MPLPRHADAADLEPVLAQLVTTLKAGGAMSGEQLQRVLRVNNQQLAQVLELSLGRGIVSKQGPKRAALYALR